MDIQAYTRRYLADALDGVTVKVTVPNPRPAMLAVVRREGGAEIDAHHASAGIGITMWAPTEAEAARLATEVALAMRGFVYRDGIAKVTEETRINDPDPEDGSPRWYASYTIIDYPTDELDI